MKIRSATPADVSAVLPMVAKLCDLHQAWDAAKYGFTTNPAQRYQSWMARQATSDRSVFLVAEAENNHLVAFLIATIEQEIPIYRLKEFGFIHDLWVEPEYRKVGVARQLVEQALQQFQQMGIQQVRLNTAVENEAARQLFQACGFQSSEIEMLRELKDFKDR